MSCIVSTQWYVLCSTWKNAVFDLVRRRVLQVQYRTSKLNIAPLRAVFLRVQHSGRGSVEVHKASGEKCGLGNAHLGQRLPPYDDPPAPQKPSPITTRPSRLDHHALDPPTSHVHRQRSHELPNRSNPPHRPVASTIPRSRQSMALVLKPLGARPLWYLHPGYFPARRCSAWTVSTANGHVSPSARRQIYDVEHGPRTIRRDTLLSLRGLVAGS